MNEKITNLVEGIETLKVFLYLKSPEVYYKKVLNSKFYCESYNATKSRSKLCVTPKFKQNPHARDFPKIQPSKIDFYGQCNC